MILGEAKMVVLHKYACLDKNMLWIFEVVLAGFDTLYMLYVVCKHQQRWLPVKSFNQDSFQKIADSTCTLQHWKSSTVNNKSWGEQNLTGLSPIVQPMPTQSLWKKKQERRQGGRELESRVGLWAKIGTGGNNNDILVYVRAHPSLEILGSKCDACGSHLTPIEMRNIALAAQRAQDAQTGCCTDYCAKNQLMGFHEIKEYQNGHVALNSTLKDKSAARWQESGEVTVDFVNPNWSACMADLKRCCRRAKRYLNKGGPPTKLAKDMPTEFAAMHTERHTRNAVDPVHRSVEVAGPSLEAVCGLKTQFVEQEKACEIWRFNIHDIRCTVICVYLSTSFCLPISLLGSFEL